MAQAFFKIENLPDGPENLEEEINRRVADKEKKGLYEGLPSFKKEDFDFLDVKSGEQFIEYYLKVIKRSWEIDINDFEIPKKKGVKGFFELSLKKIIWKLLKFYTYRIFSQQIEFNSQIRNTLIGIHEEFNPRIKNLENEIENLKNDKQG